MDMQANITHRDIIEHVNFMAENARKDLREETDKLRGEMQVMNSDILGIKDEMKEMKEDIKELKDSVKKLGDKVDEKFNILLQMHNEMKEEMRLFRNLWTNHEMRIQLLER